LHFSARARSFQCAVLIAIALVASISLSSCGMPRQSGLPTQQISIPPANAGILASTAPTVLLFNGSGTSSSDVAAVETILNNMKVVYATATSSQIGAMSVTKLASYKLLIVPGGNSITIGNNLSKTATANIHSAIINNGLHYLGICAGAFFGGFSKYNGLNLTSGVWFNTWPNSGKGTGPNPVYISYPAQSKLDQYWQDGPVLKGWGLIVAKYPDATPAVVEGWSGKGWVVLCGFHPEAPASWRTGMTFTTSVATDNAYATTLINAAMGGTSLAHY
jgi:glutamine amidotransferase-like uncharacterized protein